MRPTPMLLAMLTPAAAAADPGHIAEVAGHSHWIAGAAIATAAALGLLAWGKKDKPEAEEEAEETPDGAQA